VLAVQLDEDKEVPNQLLLVYNAEAHEHIPKKAMR